MSTPTSVPPTMIQTVQSPQTQTIQEIRPKNVKLEWDDQTEEMVAGWTDVAACYKWLHTQSFHKYDRINFTFNVPISIFSTISGVVSVGMNSLVPPDYVDLAGKVVGGVNVFTGILTYFQTYLKFGQKIESHSHAALGWSKLERNMRIELKIDRSHRKDADGFIKVSRSEYDRLIEQSPVIPPDIVAKFKKKFIKQTHLVKPDICDGITHAEITKPVEIVVEAPPDPVVIPTYPDLSHQAILNEIKDMLAESRLVPIGMKDVDIPHRNRNYSYAYGNIPITNATTSNRVTTAPTDIAEMAKPRKSFLAANPPPMIRLPTALEPSQMPNVKEIAAQFERRNTFLSPPPPVKKPSDDLSTSTSTGAFQVMVQDEKPRTSISENMNTIVEQLSTVALASLASVEEVPQQEEESRTPRAEIQPLNINDLL